MTDITGLRIEPVLMFCSTPDCPLFGLLTIAGTPTDEEKLKMKHTKTND